MWQNPLLPPHLLVQSLLLGAAVLMLAVAFMDTTTGPDGSLRLEPSNLYWLFVMSSLIHVLMICGEVSLTHPTAHARLAIWEMVHGRYKTDFWIGVALSIIGGLIPALALWNMIDPGLGVAGAPPALIGMMLFEHAYVQAGQSVPLA